MSVFSILSQVSNYAAIYKANPIDKGKLTPSSMTMRMGRDFSGVAFYPLIFCFCEWQHRLSLHVVAVLAGSHSSSSSGNHTEAGSTFEVKVRGAVTGSPCRVRISPDPLLSFYSPLGRQGQKCRD
jgi:hypothetical protein